MNILEYDFEIVDYDLGEMFINLPLDLAMQLLSGVSFTPYRFDFVIMHPELKEIYPDLNAEDGTEDPILIAVWNRSWMGYYPYIPLHR